MKFFQIDPGVDVSEYNGPPQCHNSPILVIPNFTGTQRGNGHVKECMRLLKGIGLGLTCTRKGINEGNERDRVRVNMHP